MLRQVVYTLIAGAGLAAGACQVRGDELYYHTNTFYGSVTSYSGSVYPPAVKFDLPLSSRPYDITSFGVLSSGRSSVFPANTKIAIRVWDANGSPVYTSAPFDVSQQDSSLAMRWFNFASDNVQVSGSFYAGFQEINNGFNFGYKYDAPSGNDYGRSWNFLISNGMKTAATDDFWFNTTVINMPRAAAWAASSGSWSAAGNWSGGVPGIAGDTATFGNVIGNGSATVTLDVPAALGALTFSTTGTGNYTLNGSGTNTLTANNSGSGATITVASGIHVINVPVVLADRLTVKGSGTLTFGNSSRITGSGQSLTMSGSGGRLILSGTNTYTGGTTVTEGKLILTNNKALADGTSLTVGNALLFSPIVPNAAPSGKPLGATAGTTPASGPGKLVLSGSNSYFGATNLASGTLTIHTAALLPSGSSASLNGTIENTGGTLAQLMTGSSQLILSGTNTYTRGTTVTEGKLILTNNTALADGTSLAVGDALLVSPIVPGEALCGEPLGAAATEATASVPEPGTLMLLASALGGAAVACRFRSRRAVEVPSARQSVKIC